LGILEHFTWCIPSAIRHARKPQVSNLGMNGILSERSQVEPGEAEQIGT
jgi:hypothetical protein